MDWLKDCEVIYDLDLNKNCVGLDLCPNKGEYSIFVGLDTSNVSAAAGWLIEEGIMPLTINDEVLKQDLKVM